MHQNPRTVILTRDILAAPASSTQVVPPMPQNLVSLYKSKLYCAEQIYSLQGARYQVGYEAGIHAASFMESNPQN